MDSLIVTDLIDLARNHAISDAVLLSGDEDVRVAVQIAQSFGVRVHLIGITPCRGSQSLALLQEADTTTEWEAVTVSKFLSLKPSLMTAICATDTEVIAAYAVQAAPSSASRSDIRDVLDSVAHDILSEVLSMNEIDTVLSACSHDYIPNEIHGRLLARSRERIGRPLDAQEKRDVRECFVVALEDRISK